MANKDRKPQFVYRQSKVTSYVITYTDLKWMLGMPDWGAPNKSIKSIKASDKMRQLTIFFEELP